MRPVKTPIWLAVLALALWVGSAAALVQPPSRTPTHEDILRGFDASALSASREDVAYGGNYDPVGMIVKWQKPIVYKIEGLRARPDAVNLAIATLKQQAALAGVEVRAAKAPSEANYTIAFRNVANFDIGDRKAVCYITYSFNSSGHMQWAELQINLAAPSLERCVRHEILHGFGLMNHPHRLHSVLSYHVGDQMAEMTEADIVLLRTLYDARILPAMSRLAALVTADGLIEANRRILNPAAPPRTPAAPVLRDAIADLEAAAANNNVRALMYLAEAAAQGYVMPKDAARVAALIDRAAATRDLTARFDLALSLATGRYVPRDPARAAALYRRNAEAGHAVSQNNYAVMLRDGIGVPVDRTAALAWFTLAARGNVAVAERSRLALAQTLPPDQRQEAMRRVAAWKPVPEAAR
jgi:TPR repeat protein